jgi:hypothetical protein
VKLQLREKTGFSPVERLVRCLRLVGFCFEPNRDTEDVNGTKALSVLDLGVHHGPVVNIFFSNDADAFFKPDVDRNAAARIRRNIGDVPVRGSPEHVVIHFLPFACDLLSFAAATGTDGPVGVFLFAVAIFSLLSNVSLPGLTGAPPSSLALISSAPICATRSAVHSAT